MRTSAPSKVPKNPPMPAQGASAPHEATVENSNEATAAVSEGWSDTGQGSLGKGPPASPVQYPDTAGASGTSDRQGEAARAQREKSAEVRAAFLNLRGRCFVRD